MADNQKESALSQQILSELSSLMQEVEKDTKQRNSVKKYLGSIKKEYEKSDIDATRKLLLKQTQNELTGLYPVAREILEKLSIDVKRQSEQGVSSLFARLEAHCNEKGIPLQGKTPKMFIDHLIEFNVNEKKKTAKIGIVNLPNLNWEKVQAALDQERRRVWGREFDPTDFRDRLLNICSELLRIKPSPVGWVRLEDIYQSLKIRAQQENPDWRKGGRLVAYYKDEFSADLSLLWRAQIDHVVDRPHTELSGVRDPRLAFRVTLPDGQNALYGYIRPKREGI